MTMNPINNNPTNREKNRSTGSQSRKCSGRDPCRGKILPGSSRHPGEHKYEQGRLPDFFRQNLQATYRHSGVQQYDHGRLQEFIRQSLPAPEPELGEAG
jgi:hypothetical protein